MTLAFIVASPAGFAADLADKIPGAVEYTLVAGSDSRFTSADGQVRSDLGAKLWHIEPGITAAFAGYVPSAEIALGALVRRLRTDRDRAAGHLAEMARDAFQIAVPPDRRTGLFRFLIALGVRTTSEMIVLRFSSEDDFAPLPCGHAVLGDPVAVRRFLDLMNARTAPRGRAPRNDRREEIVANGQVLHDLSLACLKAAVDEVGGTVGGPLQTARLGLAGTETFTSLALDFEPERWQLGESPRLERISARPDEVRTATKRETSRLSIPLSRTSDHDVVVGMIEGFDGRLLVVKRGPVLGRATAPAHPHPLHSPHASATPDATTRP